VSLNQVGEQKIKQLWSEREKRVGFILFHKKEYWGNQELSAKKYQVTLSSTKAKQFEGLRGKSRRRSKLKWIGHIN